MRCIGSLQSVKGAIKCQLAQCVFRSGALQSRRASYCKAGPRIPETTSYSDTEKLVDLSAVLAQAREQSEDFVFDDPDNFEPVWEHENRFKGKPMTLEELQQPAPQLFQPDPLQAVADVANAYSAEQGFREVSVQELSVALTAGGLVDLVLDVRTTEEYAAGPVVPGAINIPLSSLSDAVRSGQLDQYIDGHIVAVCASGQRSAQATVRLSKVFGFQHVSNVSGGMAAWQAMNGNNSRGNSTGGGCGCGGGGCH